MVEKELLAVLRLQAMSLVGDVTAKKLIAHCGSAQAVFETAPQTLEKIMGIGSRTLTHLKDPKFEEAARVEWEVLQKMNWGYTYFKDPEYPEWLRHAVDGPILLFHKGNINWQGQRIISIVGTRDMTAHGRRFCEELVAELAPLDPIIVSGLAYGVDITAHKAALTHGLQTIACMAHGLNQTYPRAHAKYAKQICEHGGLVTDFWSDTEPDREHFLQRNRIIAGLSEATIVIESGAKGGSLVTADIAHSYDRDVFAVPGRPGDSQSLGCNSLIKAQKARILTTAADLVYHLGWEIEKPAPVQTQLFVTLPPEEQKVCDYLKKNGKTHIDAIALDLGVPVFKLSPLLLNLEMQGLVRPLPGKMYEKL
ncbi:DNA-processing protein DprA [Sediminicola luteus]|uniref:DNA protecting protein DprA n=1 Tax=Sediminicola luteus TaxID=319238 RepID=A0A2A4GEE1_9FLAO|nr:DNA-processing protein DprA [Sediminicola luteus]PCE66781.1 DNA protecting protein DprA [Sediminicola luteus]